PHPGPSCARLRGASSSAPPHQPFGHAPWQVLPLPMHAQRILPLELADRDRAALARLMDDEMRAAAQRHLHARAHLRLIGKLCEPCFEPALMTVEKAFDLTAS